jgi:hypothetical protein
MIAAEQGLLAERVYLLMVTTEATKDCRLLSEF